jgi:competence CoiA-like predicted nuclease
MDAQRQHWERPLQRLIEAYQQEIMTLQELSTRREQIAQRLKGFAQEKSNLEQQRDTTIQWERIADHIHQCRALLGSHLDRLRYEDRQAVVQLLVEQVVVYPEGAVAVHHVLPFEEQPVAADQKKKGPPGECYVLRLKQLNEPTQRMALDDIKRPPTQVGSDQRARGLFVFLFDRHDQPVGVMRADG